MENSEHSVASPPASRAKLYVPTGMSRIFTMSADSLVQREAGFAELTRLYNSCFLTPMPMVSVVASPPGSPIAYTFCVRGRDEDAQLQGLMKAVALFRTKRLPQVSLDMHYVDEKKQVEVRMLLHHREQPNLLPGQWYFEAALEGKLKVGYPLDGRLELIELTEVNAEHGGKEDLAKDEAMFQNLFKKDLQETFGHKPWDVADQQDTLYFGNRCICRIHDAVMVAEPCEHLALCAACYSEFGQKSAVFLERCPKCAQKCTCMYNLEE